MERPHPARFAPLVALGLFVATSAAQAQEPPPPHPPSASPPAPQPAPQPYPPPAAPPAYGSPPPGYAPAPPAYGPPPPYAPPPGYGAPYGAPYAAPLPAGPPPPPPPPPSRCCSLSIRFDPLQLLFHRLGGEIEATLYGPLTLEVAPAWIFGTGAAGIDHDGFSVALRPGVYFGGKPLKSYYLKAHLAYESFESVVDPIEGPGDDVFAPGTGRVKTTQLGLMVGSASVYGKNGGFAVSGGLGFAVNLAGRQTVCAPVRNPQPNQIDRACAVYFDKLRSAEDQVEVRGPFELLMNISLGVTF